MIASVVNALAVLLGSLLGLVIGRRMGDQMKAMVFSGVGIVALVIGVSMALESQRFMYLALSLVLGGAIGTALGIEQAIFRLGEWLRDRFVPATTVPTDPTLANGQEHSFAQGFLVASVLFCVGALTVLGAFQAGVDGNYELLLTKSVMDGFMAIILTASYGIGVAFSAITILVYQGALTALAGVLAPFVSDLMFAEISGVGGAMAMMIGINLLQLREIKTANYLPGLVIVVAFVVLDPWIGRFVL